jgi:hypothetical protein
VTNHEVEVRLAAINQRLKDASEGPWDVDCHSHIARGCRCTSCRDSPTGWFLDTPSTLDCDDFVARLGADAKNDFGHEVKSCEDGPFVSFEDADFAAHAREDVPFLLEIIERLMK